MRAKYIVTDTGYEDCIVFSELKNHDDMARAFNAIGKVVGAGFCYVDNDRYTCYGSSTTLGIKSRGVADEKVLNVNLGQAPSDVDL